MSVGSMPVGGVNAGSINAGSIPASSLLCTLPDARYQMHAIRDRPPPRRPLSRSSHSNLYDTMTDTTQKTTTSDSSGGPAPLYDQARALGRYLRALGEAEDRAAQQAERSLFTARLRDADTLWLDVRISRYPSVDAAPIKDGDPLTLRRDYGSRLIFRILLRHRATGDFGFIKPGIWLKPIRTQVGAVAMRTGDRLRCALVLPDLTVPGSLPDDYAGCRRDAE